MKEPIMFLRMIKGYKIRNPKIVKSLFRLCNLALINEIALLLTDQYQLIEKCSFMVFMEDSAAKHTISEYLLNHS